MKMQKIIMLIQHRCLCFMFDQTTMARQEQQKSGSKCHRLSDLSILTGPVQARSVCSFDIHTKVKLLSHEAPHWETLEKTVHQIISYGNEADFPPIIIYRKIPKISPSMYKPLQI